MATILGKDGSIELGSDVVAEIQKFSINRGAASIDASTMGNDGWEKTRPGTKNWSIDVECFYDPDDTAQQAIQVGDEIVIHAYPEGNTSGQDEFTGTAMIETFDISLDNGGLAQLTIKAKGNGVLTQVAVV